MERVFKIPLSFLFLLPLLSWLSIYTFVLFAIITKGTPQFYDIDPKEIGFNGLQDMVLVFTVSGIMVIPFLIVVLLKDLLQYKIQKRQILLLPIKLLSFIGVALLISTFFFDPERYLFWFFD